MHLLRHEDLAWDCGGLRTCGDIHHRADRGQITMGVTELAKLHDSRSDPYADAERPLIDAMLTCKVFEPGATILLQKMCRCDGAGGVVGMLHREIEYRHHGVADRLVEQSVWAQMALPQAS